MGTVGINDLSSGMELQSPLISKQGRQLLPAGVVLNAKHINTLKVWGIVEADIVGEGESDNTQKKLNELPPDLVAKTKQHTLTIFQLTDTKHPAVRSLAKLSLSRTANALYFTNNWQKAFASPEPPVFSPNGSAPPDLTTIIQKDVKLASLPEIFHQIIAAINDPKTSASHIANIVSKDTSLSAKLLRLVNSPYYGFRERIDTLSRALALVGTDKLANLALGITAVNAFKDIDSSLFDMQSFWEHSIRCALAASWLASQIDSDMEESYFISGLLHDFGWLIMLKLYPDACKEVLHAKLTDNRTSYKIEKEMWGFNHAELGGMVLKEWDLPYNLVSGIMHHHSPGMVKYELSPSLIHVSDFAAHALNTRLDVPTIPPLLSGAWNALGLTHNVFGPMATQVDAQLSEIMQVFFDG